VAEEEFGTGLPTQEISGRNKSNRFKKFVHPT
jgi:hypothetical protein